MCKTSYNAVAPSAYDVTRACMRKEGKEGCEGRPGKERAPLLFGILFAPITVDFKHAKYEQQDMMSCSRVSVLNKAVVLKLVTPITMF